MTTALFLSIQTGRRGVPQRRSFERWIAAIPELRRRRVAVNILVVGAAEGRQFNRRFRHKDCATNVLSFPYEPLPGEPSRLKSANLLGDLVICAPVVAREAAAQGKTLRDHYAHLTLHGVLHLLGYDHQTATDAAKMETLEVRLLAGVGIPDPYA